VSCLLKVYLEASWEHTWERIVKQVGSVLSNAIGNVVEGVFGSVVESILGANLGAYSQEGWECAIKHNSEHLESVPGNIQSSRPGGCHRVQFEVP
jgi:hypothetical protein